MYPESKDAEALDSVDDNNKGAQTLADDITKRVATRLVANCNRYMYLELKDTEALDSATTTAPTLGQRSKFFGGERLRALNG
jgi:hypothetical protein